MPDERTKLAEAVRKACMDAAIQAHEDAGLSGLCQEGRWECAVQAIRQLDLVTVILRACAPDGPPPQEVGHVT
jgi:hypothetical protein